MVGDSEGRLHRVTLPRPAPEPGEVLIRVLAVTVNRLDMQMRRHMPQVSGPNAVPGCDCAGIVAGHGAVPCPLTVAALPMGTLVEATARPLGIGSGTYAEWATAPVRQVAAVPDGVSPEAAACIAFSGLAAHQGMYAAMPEAGETVLVNGAADAVGHFAIQIASRDGARVICNTPPAAAAMCLALGGAALVDSRAEDLGAAVLRLVPGGVDGELDLVDGATGAGSVRALARRGRLVSLISVPERSLLADRRITAWRVDVQPDGAMVAKLLDLAAAGQLGAVIQDVIPLASADDAHRRMERGGVHGKLVLQVARRA